MAFVDAQHAALNIHICLRSVSIYFQIWRQSIDGMSTIESHHSEQMVGVGTTRGHVLLLHFDDSDGLQLLATYHLSSAQIEAIRFVDGSMTLFALDADGALFHVAMSTYDVCDVNGLIQCDAQIRDVSVQHSNEAVHIFTLSCDETQCYGCLIRIDGANGAHSAPMRVPLKYRYSSMQLLASDRVVGFRKMSKAHTIDVLDVQVAGNELQLVERQSIETSHICESIRWVVDAARVLVTLGSDGKLIEWHMDPVSVMQSAVIFDSAPEESAIDIACSKR